MAKFFRIERLFKTMDVLLLLQLRCVCYVEIPIFDRDLLRNRGPTSDFVGDVSQIIAHLAYRAVFTQIFQNMIDVACENGHFNRHDAT